MMDLCHRIIDFYIPVDPVFIHLRYQVFLSMSGISQCYLEMGPENLLSNSPTDAIQMRFSFILKEVPFD